MEAEELYPHIKKKPEVISRIYAYIDVAETEAAQSELDEYVNKILIKELDSWRDELLSLGTCGVCVVIDEMESAVIRLRDKLKQ